MKVVVTGVGAVTSVGGTAKEMWNALKEGKSGVRNITNFDPSECDTRIAGEVSNDFEEKGKEIIPKRIRKQMTRTTRMAIVAAEEAIKDSRIDESDLDKKRIAVIMGVIDTTYDYKERLESELNMVVKRMPNAPSAWITILHGYEGVNFNVSSACASSAYAISIAASLIQSGMYDIVITGGVDSTITADGIKGFNQIMALSTKNGTPETACRPFSKSRDGFVMGEGSGIIVLENEETAKKRNAKIYGELAGFAFTSEASGITAPKADGVGMAETMRMALSNANIEKEEVDYINAHGTSTSLNDKYETMAVKEVFAEHANELCISSTKSMTGHTLGAAGAIEAIITLLTIKEQIVPPTINYNDLDEELDLDYVPNSAQYRKVDVALSNSFGFGGHNGTLVFCKYVE